jgi:uncharacterized protein
MLASIHSFPSLCLLLLGVGLELYIVHRMLARGARPSRVWLAALAATALLAVGYLLEFGRFAALFPALWATWIDCASILEVLVLALYAVKLALPGQARDSRKSGPPAPDFAAQRRALLQTSVAAAVCAVPVVAATFGLITRNRFQLSEVKIPIAGLPKDLDGLRIVQITDIHLSPFLSEREFAHAIDMANETRAHIALVTGDLISRRGDPLDACLHQLARLRAEAGVVGCLGNHEIYTGTTDYVASEGARIGIDFLRGRARQFRFGGASLNFAGVDYQRFGHPYLEDAGKLVVPGIPNILLSHNPDVFPVAASQGYHLTISGHTHGGQVDFEILHQHMNVARAYTSFVSGLYRRGDAFAYVSRGLGTIGIPVRIGAVPEVSLLRLCAT